MSLLILLFTKLSTVDLSGNIAFTDTEVSAISTTMMGVGKSLLGILQDFRQPLLVLGVVGLLITFIMNLFLHRR